MIASHWRGPAGASAVPVAVAGAVRVYLNSHWHHTLAIEGVAAALWTRRPPPSKPKVPIIDHITLSKVPRNKYIWETVTTHTAFFYIILKVKTRWQKNEAKIIVLLSLVKCAVGVKFQKPRIESSADALFNQNAKRPLCYLFLAKLSHTDTLYLSPNSVLMHFSIPRGCAYISVIDSCILLHCG